jgi:hypothetical protein
MVKTDKQIHAVLAVGFVDGLTTLLILNDKVEMVWQTLLDCPSTEEATEM